MRTRRPEHLKTFAYLGLYRYFLTFCTYRRHRRFGTADRVSAVRAQIERAAREERFALAAYCFMPDHLHLLIEGQDDGADCLRFITRAKQRSGYHYQAAFGERLWQRYGFERTLRDHDSTLSIARYIVENPVRAGLVERVADYPFSGSALWTVDEIVEAVQLRGDWRTWSAP